MILTNVILTGYCSCHLCCGSHAKQGITADGHKPIAGITVAASRSIPFGTHVIISGHTYTVQDRLAKKYNGRIDIYFDKHKDALRFGKQTNNATIELPRTIK